MLPNSCRDYQEIMTTASKYYWGCCMVCRKAGTSGRRSKEDEGVADLDVAGRSLQCCSGCGKLYYCSRDHQKQDWPRHRSLCRVIGGLRQGGALKFDGARDVVPDVVREGPSESLLARWNSFKLESMERLSKSLGRPLEEHEKEVILFPRVCRICLVDAAPVQCRKCAGVAYCGEDHRMADLSRHQGAACADLKYAMVCDNYESTVSVAAPPIPAALDETFDPNLAASAGWDMVRHLCATEPDEGDGETVDLKEMEFRFLSDRLTGPMTILSVLARIGRLASGVRVEEARSLVLHLVGSNIVEMLGIIKWEYLAHRLPALQTLRFVFIGPELAELEDRDGEAQGLGSCQDCADRGKVIKYELQRKTYHEYDGSGTAVSSEPPDAVVAFNCGFHEHAGDPEKDTWKPSLPLLVRHLNTPLIFTSYTLTEAKKDMQCLMEAVREAEGGDDDPSKVLQFLLGTDDDEASGGLQPLLAAPRLNPFRSHRPIRDFELDNNCDVFFSNQYVSVVARKVSRAS